MRNARKLVLRKEALFELSTDELLEVAGGATPGCQTLPVANCLSRVIYPCTTKTILSQIIDPCITG